MCADLARNVLGQLLVEQVVVEERHIQLHASVEQFELAAHFTALDLLFTIGVGEPLLIQQDYDIAGVEAARLVAAGPGGEERSVVAGLVAQADARRCAFELPRRRGGDGVGHRAWHCDRRHAGDRLHPLTADDGQWHVRVGKADGGYFVLGAPHFGTQRPALIELVFRGAKECRVLRLFERDRACAIGDKGAVRERLERTRGVVMTKVVIDARRPGQRGIARRIDPQLL